MNDDLARSTDPCQQMAQKLESDIQRIRTEIQAADNRKQLHLLANELQQALGKMDDFERGLNVHDLPTLVAPFFQF